MIKSNNLFEPFEIKKEEMESHLYWCFVKYYLDQGGSKVGTGARRSKVGEFIDRFTNQISNWLVFQHILQEYDFDVVRDNFFYSDKKAKKAPDILGLRKNNKIIPFSIFENKWVPQIDKPQVEVKTLRENQYLGAIPNRQYEDNLYYCFVDANYDDNYLLNFFQPSIYNYHDDMSMEEDFIRDNSEGYILNPPYLSKPQNIGTLKLLGTYKGSELKKYSKYCEVDEKPYYLKDIKPFDGKKFSTWEEIDEIVIDGKYEHTSSHIPIYVSHSSMKSLRNPNQQKRKTTLNIIVDEPIQINGFYLEKGIWKLVFTQFERNAKTAEYLEYKSILDVSNHQKFKFHPKDCTNELIQKFVSLCD